MKHTPGPWKTKNNAWLTGMEDEFLQNVYASNGYACARGYGETREECEANAALIVAAPLMYDILESIASGDFKDKNKFYEWAKGRAAVALDAVGGGQS